jgi:hypothetical protein
MEQLAHLAPQGSDVARPASEVLARIQSQVAGSQRVSDHRPGRFPIMMRRRSAVVLVSLVLLLVVSLALPPVRAAASDFLGLFRVQKFAPISVSPQQLQLLEEIADQGLYPGEFESIDEPGPQKVVGSLAEAQSETGLTVLSPEALGPADEIRVADGGSGRLTVDVENARAILRAAEVDPALLPDSLDGAVVDVTIFPGVEQVWLDAEGQSSGVRLLQTQSPLVDYPEGVDTAQLGEALLQVLGMTPGEARRLAHSIDWNSTLVFPVPTNVAAFSEVTVGGESALALTSMRGNESSLMWQNGGNIFLLVGERSVAELQQLAESVR